METNSIERAITSVTLSPHFLTCYFKLHPEYGAHNNHTEKFGLILSQAVKDWLA
jgi:hypothetical protein